MKTKTQFTNRILSLVLSIMMVISMLPMSSFTALAADGTTNTITDFSVTRFELSDSLYVGWPDDIDIDLDGVSDDVQDEGKTEWEDSDKIFVTLTSQKYGTQTVALIFDAHSYSWAADGYFRYAEGETPRHQCHLCTLL